MSEECPHGRAHEDCADCHAGPCMCGKPPGDGHFHPMSELVQIVGYFRDKAMEEKS